MINVLVSVVLTQWSRDELLRQVPPLFSNIIAHHMTVAFKPSEEKQAYYQTRAGQKVMLKVIGFANDRLAQAVRVTGCESENAHPHITLSLAPGVKPVYSNELLAFTPPIYLKPFYLEGIFTIELL